MSASYNSLIMWSVWPSNQLAFLTNTR